MSGIYNFVNRISFRSGRKTKNDFLIYVNDQQIKDVELFFRLMESIPSSNIGKDFINYYVEYDELVFKEFNIITNTPLIHKDKLYNYCNSKNINKTIQELLFISILRCNIDNICYPPNKGFNGCVRTFIQVLLTVSYKFRWNDYKFHNKVRNIPIYVSDIGYPNNQYKISTNEFKKLYNKFYINYFIKKTFNK